MHPDVISDKSGLCPKCSMDLVRFDAKGNNNHKNCKMNKNKNGNSNGSDCGMIKMKIICLIYL